MGTAIDAGSFGGGIPLSVLARRRIPDDLVVRYCGLADALAEQSLVRV